MHRPRTLAPRLTRRLPHAPAQNILELRLSRRPPRTAPNTLEPRLLRRPSNPSSAISYMIPYISREGHRHHKHGIPSCNLIRNRLPAYRGSSPRASPHGSTGIFMITSHLISADPLSVVSNIASRTAITTHLDIAVFYVLRFTHYTCSMTSTPTVCLTDIEQCLSRSLMTIAAHLLNITISSVWTEIIVLFRRYSGVLFREN